MSVWWKYLLAAILFSTADKEYKYESASYYQHMLSTWFLKGHSTEKQLCIIFCGSARSFQEYKKIRDYWVFGAWTILQKLSQNISASSVSILTFIF